MKVLILGEKPISDDALASLEMMGADCKIVLYEQPPTPTQVTDLLEAQKPSLVLLTKTDAEVAKNIKISPKKVGLVVTTRADKAKIRNVYDAGADMCIPEPLDPELLAYQLRAVARHYPEKTNTDPIEIGEYTYDPVSYKLSHPDVAYRLSPKQRLVFEYLARRKNTKVSVKNLLTAVFGDTSEFAKRSLDVHICTLRKMLSSDPSVVIRTLYAGSIALVVDGEPVEDELKRLAR